MLGFEPEALWQAVAIRVTIVCRGLGPGYCCDLVLVTARNSALDDGWRIEYPYAVWGCGRHTVSLVVKGVALKECGSVVAEVI